MQDLNPTDEPNKTCNSEKAQPAIVGLRAGLFLPEKKCQGRPPKSVVHYIVEAGSGCWIWQRGTNRFGYGRMWVGNRLVAAHRHFYECAKGPIPRGKYIDHLCKKTSCVNPNHLEAVSPAVNTQRSNSAKLTPDQVLSIRQSSRDGEGSKSIAAKFGISTGYVWKIVRRKCWRSLKVGVMRSAVSP